MHGSTIQGRIQLTKSGQFTSTGRNCKLFSAASGSTSKTASTMTVGSSLGSDCSYKTSGFSASTTMYSVYAHTADQCCKACVAAKGCVGAEWVDDGSAFGPGGGGPQPYEGFGLHLVNVQSSKTTGGIGVSTLEEHFAKRLGDLSSFDAFMDYNVVLFAGEDLASYAQALAHDNVKFFTGTWTASSSTWYSVIVHVPGSQMVIELVSKTSPGLQFTKSAATLEARLSPRQVTRFDSVSANGILQAVAVTRPCSNMSSVEYFYTNAIGATTVHSIDLAGASSVGKGMQTLKRRCFAWSGAESDVCFTSRSTNKDADFTVLDFETMLWSAHKAMIGSQSGVSTTSDKYNDNHYAVDLPGFSGDSIAAWLKTNAADAFPIDFPKTYFAWDCMQNYLIDPTGWSIQSDFRFSWGVNYPGCGWGSALRR